MLVIRREMTTNPILGASPGLKTARIEFLHYDGGDRASWLVPAGTGPEAIAGTAAAIESMLSARYPHRQIVHRQIDETRGVLKAK